MADPSDTQPPLTHMQLARRFVLVAALYFLVALASLWISSFPYKVATLWFATPVGTVALLTLATRHWPALLVLLALTNLLLSLVARHLGLELLFDPAIFAAGSCAEMALAAFLLRRLHISPDMLHQPSSLGRTLIWGALVPSTLSSLAAAGLLSLWHEQSFLPAWTVWFAGGLIGSLAALPLGLTLWQEGLASLLRRVQQLRTAGLLLLTMAVTVLAVHVMPQPFIIVALPLVFLAARAGFAITALATPMVAALLGLLQSTGVLYRPVSAHWWNDGMFYSSFLASLLPGLFLAASVEGRSRVMQQLAASERRFRALYTETPALLHSIDPDGRITQVSQLWLKTLGYEESDVLGRRSADFMTPESARYAREEVLPQSIRDGRCDNIEYQMVTRDGRVLDMVLAATWTYDADGKPLHSVAVLQDVTEKKRLAERSHYAEHDPLTGLPNRVLLQDRLEFSCSLHERHGTQFAIGFLDLDHFKEINDTHGHEAGDELLKEIARRLQRVLRTSDTICRLAGDEFVLLFADMSTKKALEQVAQKILATIIQPISLGDGPQAPVVTVGASLGIAIFPEHGNEPAPLLTHADQAMYAAKHKGRNRVEFYSKALEAGSSKTTT